VTSIEAAPELLEVVEVEVVLVLELVVVEELVDVLDVEVLEIEVDVLELDVLDDVLEALLVEDEPVDALLLEDVLVAGVVAVVVLVVVVGLEVLDAVVLPTLDEVLVPELLDEPVVVWVARSVEPPSTTTAPAPATRITTTRATAAEIPLDFERRSFMLMCLTMRPQMQIQAVTLYERIVTGPFSCRGNPHFHPPTLGIHPSKSTQPDTEGDCKQQPEC
jgi:hypothetical protein